MVAEKDGVQTTESTGVNRPITIFTYDNLNELIQTQVFDGDGVSLPDPNDIADFETANASLLVSQTETDFDNQGQIFETEVDNVDPTTGDVGAPLTSQTYYDSRGNVIEQTQPNGPTTKYTYNGLDEPTVVYTTDGGGGTSYTAASSAAGDIVLTQTEYTDDADGNVIETVERDRLPSASGTGALDNATTQPEAQVSYTASYFDAAGRDIADVDVGTNGGTSWTRPGSLPSRSSTVLVTSYDFDSAGNQEDVIDPNGVDTRTEYDNLGNPTETIQDYGTGDTNNTTEYTYGPAGMTSMTVVQPGGTNQTTAWVYGVSTSTGSAIDSNDMVAATEYPDPTTGEASTSQETTQTVDAQGQTLTMTDRNGTTHEYSYDSLGRLIADTVTALGSGVDGSVMKITYAYDGQAIRTSSPGLALLLGGMAFAQWTAAAPAADKPNIIFILSDDVGLGNIGCYGGCKPRTPAPPCRRRRKRKKTSRN
jgi:YD repeat-containing protein